MNLKTYRTENNIKMTEVAAAVGKSVQHLYEIERGDAFPSRKLAKELSAFTGGAVPVGELLYPSQPSKCGEASESAFQVADASPPPVKLRGAASVPGLSDTPPHKKQAGANKSRRKS